MLPPPGWAAVFPPPFVGEGGLSQRDKTGEGALKENCDCTATVLRTPSSVILLRKLRKMPPSPTKGGRKRCCRTGADSPEACLILQLHPAGETGCHTSDIGHWFAMTAYCNFLRMCRKFVVIATPCCRRDEGIPPYGSVQNFQSSAVGRLALKPPLVQAAVSPKVFC